MRVRRAVRTLTAAVDGPALAAVPARVRHDLVVCAEAFLRAAGDLDAHLSAPCPRDDG